MLNPKQNFLETIKQDGKPDRLVKQYEGTAFLPGDPVANYVRGQRHPGMEAKKDKWGTMIVWPVGSPGAMPKVTEETKVIRDVRRWRDFTKVPDLVANCSDQALWIPYLERVANVDRENKLVMAFAPTGIFERLHFLMGFDPFEDSGGPKLFAARHGFSGLGTRLTGKPNRESRAFFILTLDLDTAMIEMRDAFCNTQSEPGAGNETGFLSFLSKKFREQSVYAIFTYADSCVRN